MITVEQIRDLESEVMQQPNSENTGELRDSLHQFMNQIERRNPHVVDLHIDAMVTKVIHYNESAIDKILVVYGNELDEEISISK